MVNPKDHPNASMAIIVGLAASKILDVSDRLGLDFTQDDATYIATGLIGLTLFLGKKAR